MKETFPIKALVLCRYPFRERDARVVVYSQEQGKMDLVARGTLDTKSKIASHIEPLTLASMMVIAGKRYNYIGSSIALENYVRLKNRYDAVNAAGKGIRIFNELVKWDISDPELYRLITIFLETLNSRSAPEPDFLADVFIFKLVAVLGYEPELGRCVQCGVKLDEKNLLFSLAKSGLLCAKCFNEKEALPLSLNCVKALKYFIKNDLKQTTKLSVDENTKKDIALFVDKYYNYLFH